MPDKADITYLGAGPALLPTDVLESATQALLNYNNTELGIAEHSHSSQYATDIINMAKADLATYLDIPDDYEVLFMQVTKKKAEILKELDIAKEEDAHQDDLAAALKKAVEGQLKLDYLVTGGWSLKTFQEAGHLLGTEYTNLPADSRTINDGKFGKIPEESTWKLSKKPAFVYYCNDETVDGVEFPRFPEILAPKADGTGPIVVADTSSNIFLRRIPAGVMVVVIKKSLLPPSCLQHSPFLMRKLGLPIPPVVFSYETIAKNNSLYKTLSIFDVYVAGQVLKKLVKTFPDKVDGQEAVDNKKAALINEALEAYPDVYRIVPDKSVRSRMNICFRVTKNGETERSEADFLKQGTASGLTGLKGHRSVGSILASNYNSISFVSA
ncbi:phosphoserine aminotransferase [Xylariaceae sp. FL1651]|nr:phosphoserine aminotransferase [Xylariaceae sp. FL1651]